MDLQLSQGRGPLTFPSGHLQWTFCCPKQWCPEWQYHTAFWVHSLEKPMVGPRQLVKREGVGRMSPSPITMGLWTEEWTELRLQAEGAWFFFSGERRPPSVLLKHSLSSQFPEQSRFSFLIWSPTLKTRGLTHKTSWLTQGHLAPVDEERVLLCRVAADVREAFLGMTQWTWSTSGPLCCVCGGKGRGVTPRLQISWLGKTWKQLWRPQGLPAYCLGRGGGEGQKTYLCHEHHFKKQRTFKH